MISKANIAILTVSVVIGAATFVATRSLRGEGPAPTSAAPGEDRPRGGRLRALGRWLELSKEQHEAINKDDPTFWLDVLNQREQLIAERERLAKLLEDLQSTEKQITDQVERMITLGNEIERRVTKRLLIIRRHLTPEQQEKLFGLCALGVRTRANRAAQGGGRGMGRGQGWGRGRGRGR